MTTLGNKLARPPIRGMSLVELLVVISIIGIISATIIPSLGNLASQAHYAKNERNAQTIASLAASVRGAGATNSWSDVDEVIDDLEEGISIAGPTGSMEFKISPLSEDERIGAAAHLELANGFVAYRFAAE